MSLSNFPTSLDSWVDKTDNVDDVVASHINKLQDSIAALEAKIGIDDSAVTTSIDYKISGSLRQVNLLTNSGFGVWSNSTLENVGTQITLTDVTNGICLTADTQDLVIGKLFRFDSGDFSGNVYEVTAVTEDVSFTVHDTSITDTGSPGTGYEVTPGIVATGGEAMDTWTKTGTLDLFRVQNDTVHCKGFYGIKVVKGVDTSEYLIWQGNIDSKLEHYAKFAGRQVSLGCWVYSVTASDNVKVQISDSGGISTSPNVGADSLTWVEIARSIGETITSFRARFLFGGDTGDIAYISQPMLVFGSSIGEGNYVAPQGEVISFEEPALLTGFDLDAFSSVTNQPLNLEAVSRGKIPKGIKSIGLKAECRDSGSAASLICGLTTGENEYTGDFFCYCSGITNDARSSNTGIVSCNSSGDIVYTTAATGVDTLDVRLNVISISM